jgi:hypothetical protein
VRCGHVFLPRSALSKMAAKCPSPVCIDQPVSFDITPEQASHGRIGADADLPVLAAQMADSGA